MSKHEFTGPSRKNAICAAGLFLHKFVMALGVCQPTKVRRQLLCRNEAEGKGKTMINIVITVIMMMMVMMMSFDVVHGDGDEVDVITPARAASTHPTLQTREALNPQRLAQNPSSLRHALAKTNLVRAPKGTRVSGLGKLGNHSC